MKTSSCTLSYCFNTVLSNCRQKEDARQTVRHSLPALTFLHICNAANVQNKPALCRGLSVACHSK